MAKYLLALISLTSLAVGIGMWSQIAALLFIGVTTGFFAIASFNEGG